MYVELLLPYNTYKTTPCFTFHQFSQSHNPPSRSGRESASVSRASDRLIWHYCFRGTRAFRGKRRARSCYCHRPLVSATLTLISTALTAPLTAQTAPSLHEYRMAVIGRAYPICHALPSNRFTSSDIAFNGAMWHRFIYNSGSEYVRCNHNYKHILLFKFI